MATMTYTTSGKAVYLKSAISIPFKSLKVNFAPVQSGSGTPSTNNVRTISGWNSITTTICGKNIYSGSNITNEGGSGAIATETLRYPLPPGAYTVSGVITSSDTEYDTSQVALMKNSNDTSSGYTRQFQRDIRDSGTYQTTENSIYLYAYPSTSWPRSVGKIVKFDDIQIEYGHSATSYEPYSGTDYATSLGSTYYGGYIDLISGKLKVTHKMIALKDLSWSVRTGNNGYVWIAKPSEYHVASSYGSGQNFCDILPVAYTSDWATCAVGNLTLFNANNQSIYLTFSDISTEDALTSWLTQYDPHLCIKVATPETIQLTSQSINLNKGDTNIFTNANGQIEVEYDLYETFDILTAKRKFIAYTPHLVSVSAGNTQYSTFIAHFNTNFSAPIKQCIVDLPYKSDGYSSFRITHCRKNLLQVTSNMSDSGGVTITVNKNSDNEVTSIALSGSTTSSNWFKNLNYVPNQLNCLLGTYTISTNSSNVVIVNTAASVKRAGITTEDIPEYTMEMTQADVGTNVSTWYRMEIWPRDSSTKVPNSPVYPMVRIPSDNGTFEPYKGSTTTLTLPQTIYGGTVDLISGEVTSKYASDGSSITPIILLITPISMKTFSGINNIWSDKGNVTVKYWEH